MSLDALPREQRADHILYFIHADAEQRDALREAIGLLAARLADPAEQISVLVLPGEAGAIPASAFDLPDGVELCSATHGSVLKPHCVTLLPADRLFTVEQDRLQLRPRDTAWSVSPRDYLLQSLARRFGTGLHVLLLDDNKEADDGLSVVTASAGRIDTIDTLREERTRGITARVHAVPTARILPHRLAHDLRQPLQTLTLLQGLLARQVSEPRAIELVQRLGVTVQSLIDLVSHPEHGQAELPPLPEKDDDEADHRGEPIRAFEGGPATVYIIDDDRSIREALRGVLEEEGCIVKDFERCEDFIANHSGAIDGCLLVDAYLPGMSGIELLDHMRREGPALPAIMITGSSDVQMAVRAMKAGATDFIEKPVGAADLLSGVRKALSEAQDSGVEVASREKALHCLKALTRRQKQIMAMVLDGHPSKIIAADLGISQRTVENHRAAIMKKTGSRSLPALARLAMALPAHLN